MTPQTRHTAWWWSATRASHTTVPPSVATRRMSAELLEQLERRVDGRQRDAGHLRAHVAVDDLGGDVAVELAQGAGDRDPLRRDAQAAGAQGVAQSGVGGLLARCERSTNLSQS